MASKPPLQSRPSAPSASSRQAVVDDVLNLQRALEEINAKLAATHTANSALAAENETLSTYIDSLMARVGSMGGRITAPAQKGKSLRSRLSLSGRRKVVKVNDKVGELQRGSRPPPDRRRAARRHRAAHARAARRQPSDGALASPTLAPLASPTGPLASPRFTADTAAAAAEVARNKILKPLADATLRRKSPRPRPR